MNAGLFTQLAGKPDAAPRRIQRACACGGKSAQGGECEECKKKKLQRRASGNGEGSAAVTSPAARRGLESGGQPLPRPLRQHLEPLFGVDFDAVRLHDDSASHRSAASLQAHAFTYGQHVHFGAGEFAPHAPRGLHLLAHELAHTVQQRGSAPRTDASAVGDALDLDAHDAPLERAADALADAVVAGRPAAARSGAAGSVGFAARLQREARRGATLESVEVDQDYGGGTGVTIHRDLVDRECNEPAEVPQTRSTPNDRIFEWDREANALRFNYSTCRGSIRLTADTTIDYSRVVQAGTRLLDTLRNNPAAGADLPTLGRTAIDSARLDSRGNVTLTVDGILQARVGAESRVGTAEQQVRVTGTLSVTPNGMSFTITGFVDASHTPTLSAQLYSLNLRVGTRWFAVNLGYSVEERQPSTGPDTSRGTLRIGAEIPLPNVGPIRDLTLRPSLDIGPLPGGSPEVTPGLTLGGRFGGPDRTPSVRCYRCECPPPLPEYRCTPYGTREVEDRAADTQRLTLLYQYDSEQPADAAAYQARAQSVAVMARRGYVVRAIRAYASPEGTVAYNQALAQRRADAAHAAISQALPAGAGPLPAAEGVGELLGESSTRPGTEAANSALTRELVARLRGLGADERLELLGVDAAVRADEAQRQAALDDIQAFVDGRDARGRALAGRARWERVFPFLRRAEVEVHLARLAHDERVPRPERASSCDEAQRAYIDGAHQVPASLRVPQHECGR
jgi:hypothetical protein